MRRSTPLLSLVGLVLGLASGTAAAQGIQHFAVLNGGNEVSPAGAANVGDPDGSGAASIIVLPGGELCYSILVTRINTPVAAHIHEAEAGTNGPIVVGFVPPASGNPGAVSGCLAGIAPALLARIADTPNRFYVNVHTGPFPGGAVRGQLF